MKKDKFKTRIVIMVIGNLILGLGISIFKLSSLGNDPFSGMVMGCAAFVGMEYANFAIVINVFFFIIQLLTGKKYIGVGTFVNAIFLGYFATFFYNILVYIFGTQFLLFQKLIIVLIGVLVVSLGVSLYQTSDVGVSPYDSLALIMTDRFKRSSYFWNRMLTDVLCAIVCYLVGGIVGVGMLICAIGLGPFVQIFDNLVSKKIIK